MELQLKLKQKPEIVHDVEAFGKHIDSEIKALNLDNLVATTDTIKNLKETRAKLNSTLKGNESIRLEIKKGCLDAYDSFELEYDKHIKDKIASAIGIIKPKIDLFETKIKDDKKAVLRTYFDDLCQSYGIDFIAFEKVVKDVNLSTTEKKYKETINEFVESADGDIKMINQNEHSVEMMIEYKDHLNAVKAITTVINRKAELEKAELTKQKLRNESRQKLVLGMGLIFDKELQVFAYSDSIYISVEEISELNNDKFNICIGGMQADIEALKLSQSYPASPSKPAPVSAPIAEKKKEKQVQAIFKVSGSLSELMSVKDFLVKNNIKYTNID